MAGRSTGCRDDLPAKLARAGAHRVVVEALAWGSVAASSLMLGALLAFARRWDERQIGLVLGFGAGALISAVSFELAQHGLVLGGAGPVSIGLAAGALTYYGLDGAIERRALASPGAGTSSAGSALALGAFLDGIPEQLVLGIGIAAGGGVGVGLLVAIFVSNLPEAVGSAREMRTAGDTERHIVRLWLAIAAVCALASVVGYQLADLVSNELEGGIDGFAAGALLVMLIDSMIPEASAKGGRPAGLVTTLGFAVAAALSTVS
jgi:zinc transporter, ZIP family